ncbi:hypothetical protein evm_008375 [Chilo suppressalis]|nr:hypothetical protein evm_008375 [Chilo suppressalis]
MFKSKENITKKKTTRTRQQTGLEPAPFAFRANALTNYATAALTDPVEILLAILKLQGSPISSHYSCSQPYNPHGRSLPHYAQVSETAQQSTGHDHILDPLFYTLSNCQPLFWIQLWVPLPQPVNKQCAYCQHGAVIESTVMWFKTYRSDILWSVFMAVLLYSMGYCEPITNSQFNASLREYAAEETDNITDVKTLQKEYEKHSSFVPMGIPVRFKEVADSALAPSVSHARGLVHHSLHGYGIAKHDNSPHSGYGYEYFLPDDQDDHYEAHHHADLHHHTDSHHPGYHHTDSHHLDYHHSDHHHLDHHHDHHSYHDDHKHGYGHHHKHIDHHALAAKAVLWPIAGIALLGAAAALVSNPVLLQLGVVSGKRRRRDTEEFTTDSLPAISKEDLQRFDEKYASAKPKNPNNDNNRINLKTNKHKTENDVENTGTHTRAINNNRMKRKHKNNIETFYISKYHEDPEDKQYIPIPLKHIH